MFGIEVRGVGGDGEYNYAVMVYRNPWASLPKGCEHDETAVVYRIPWAVKYKVRLERQIIRHFGE